MNDLNAHYQRLLGLSDDGTVVDVNLDLEANTESSLISSTPVANAAVPNAPSRARELTQLRNALGDISTQCNSRRKSALPFLAANAFIATSKRSLFLGRASTPGSP